MSDTLRIGLVLPDVLGTYGDDGNALVLRQRARMRGYDATIVPLRLSDAIPDDLDIYTIGGGEDVAQKLAVKHLADDGGLLRAIDAGRPVLAICAGFQVLGNSFIAGGEEVSGLGVVDVATHPQQARSIGELATTAQLDGLSAPLTGFENHLGATTLGPDAKPLGLVTRGFGNPGASGAGKPGATDGAVQGSVVCTYMHGPCLARNPELADLLLARALGVEADTLTALDLPVIDRLRQERFAAKERPKSEQ
ncbi:glutamine amidotransferase [Corynebacterium sp. TAE3-ERU12]|uniref:type 1 glutamine amidotransferase n=1 Tax=Corynebacterium sp. TAE3-ERU12 TaxID=2849491 RepID=UPI001C449B14|nr:glutamine amidotransferase [Corynebacterium sp. TAE3-ERU12]MBV7294442.1 glutamine amidotransferase [Corynebacterium sp. TAE3-ERU12]